MEFIMCIMWCIFATLACQELNERANIFSSHTFVLLQVLWNYLYRHDRKNNDTTPIASPTNEYYEVRTNTIYIKYENKNFLFQWE